MRGVSVSRRGISDLPMQLLIGACIISFASPIFISAYGDLSEQLTDEKITRSVGRIMTAMEDVLSGGQGSREVIELDLKGFGSCNLESLVIGGDLEGNKEKYLISFSLSTGHRRHLSLDPPFPICTHGGEALIIGGGTYSLSIMRSQEGGTDHLFVELV